MFRNLTFILIFSVLVFGTYQSSYPSKTPKDLLFDGFWMENAMIILKKITKNPHPTGSNSNRDVRRYLSQQLSHLGAEVTVQKTQGYNKKIRKAAPVNNIVALFPGTNTGNSERKKLMLLSHYDSAKPFSLGASDAGSGVAVILESMRNFLLKNPSHENDILVVLTDGEEIGLLGAHAFVEQHHLADSIGLILNFEARGSSGPGIMWPESISGTEAMVAAYQQADVPFPVTSSLIYEVYKMLPNDTDLTVFKEQKGINGLNFAFIDNHFNYHTQNDDLAHISYNSLIHQGLQLTAMLPVVANQDLTSSYSKNDRIYFTLPAIGLVNWPAYSGWLIIAFSWLMLFWILVKAKVSKQINFTDIKKATGSWFYSSVLTGGLVYFLIYALYHWLKPQHNDILQGYPYLGYGYLLSFLLLGLIAPFYIYGNRHSTDNDNKTKSIQFVSALPAVVFWLVLFSVLSINLPGASYLLLPAIFALVLIRMMQSQEKLGVSIAVLFAVAGMTVIALLLTLVPVALGLKSAWIASLLLCWCVCLYAPMIAHHSKKLSWVFLLLPFSLFGWIANNDHISEEMPLPTSLSYLYDVDNQKGWFYSFDRNHNDWNKHHLESPVNEATLENFITTHKQAVHKLQEAEVITALPAAQMTVVVDKLNNNPSKHNIIYKGHEKTDLVQIYSLSDITIKQMSINGRYIINDEPVKIRQGSRLIEYHLDGQKELNINITVTEGDVLDWQVISHQFDLLHLPTFNVSPRPANQIPKPFVLTDNTAISQNFKIVIVEE